MSEFRKDIGKTGGIWEGSYRRMRPDGSLIEEFASRQVSRAAGDTWRNRATSRKN